MTLQQFLNQLQTLQSSLPNKQNEVDTNLGQLMLTFFLRNFDSGGYEPGVSVIPWAERKYGLDHQALQKTGYLRSSFRVAQASNGMIQLTNDAPYAQYIHEGTDKMPARPLFYESEELNAQITALIIKEFGELFQLD